MMGNPTTRASAAGGSRDVRALIRFAADALQTMRCDDALFCVERFHDRGPPEGRSLRYSLMVLLGLTKAAETGYQSALDDSALESTLFDRVRSPKLRAGDLGLYLWMDGRRRTGRAGRLLPLLEDKLGAQGLDAVEGMELAWIVIGLAHAVAAGAGAAAQGALKKALDQLLAGNIAPGGLFWHFGGRGARRRFPNFATQIYSVLALAETARLGLDARALDAGRCAGAELLRLQLPDGGWPWIFDAEKGSVVERYEIYSVHQDAMAPMALLSLAEASGDKAFAHAAVRGLDWIYGDNELKAHMMDPGARMIYRSIRRRRPWHRLMLLANTASARCMGRALFGRALRPEINRTCRPYHLGWVLEAWCGREAAAAGDPQSLSMSTPTILSAAHPSQSGTLCASPQRPSTASR